MEAFTEGVLLGNLLYAGDDVLDSLRRSREHAAVVIQRESLRLRVDQAAEAYQVLLQDYNKLVDKYNGLLANRDATRTENNALRQRVNEQDAYIANLEERHESMRKLYGSVASRLEIYTQRWRRGDKCDVI